MGWVIMKITEYVKYKKYIKKYDLANMFNVYDDDELRDNVMYYNINRTIMFTELDKGSPDDFYYYTVNEMENWNLISYKEYGTTRLWWIICKLNGIIDPTVDPKVGQILRMVTIDQINTILTSIRTE